MTDHIDAGRRDRLVLCGQAACECLGLDDNNNAPNDVRDCINKLRRERADFEIEVLTLREALKEAHSQLQRFLPATIGMKELANNGNTNLLV